MFSLSCPGWGEYREPSATELAAIEAEQPVLRAEQCLTSAEIKLLTRPSAVARRQLRRALKALLKARAQWRNASRPAGLVCVGVAA